MCSIIICFVFRRQIYAKYKQQKRKKKDKKSQNETKEEESTIETEDEKDVKENSNESSTLPNNQLSLPESRPTTPGLDGRRRKSVVFEGMIRVSSLSERGVQTGLEIGSEKVDTNRYSIKEK